MRLLSLSECDLETGHMTLRSFTGSSIPEYAILSHRWTEDEVLFEDVERQTAITRKGYFKLKGAILQACADGYAYLWDDTCCIDKSSSAELSEAINSMWTWYQDAATCYAYLCDVSSTADDPDFEDAFRSSGWFTRGWTLQELIAPDYVSFYNEAWTYVGTRETLHSLVSTITGIEASYLDHTSSLSSASIAKRMSWAAKRQTTRPEDVAYCMMGIFSVNMPMLYGEGQKAFQRLQEEILKISDDESIFAWQDKDSKPDDIHGLLAKSPVHFLYSSDIGPRPAPLGQEPCQTTSRGLKFQRALFDDQLPLNCQYHNQAGHLAIQIVPLPNGVKQFARHHLARFHQSPKLFGETKTAYFPQVIPDSKRFAPVRGRALEFSIVTSARTIGGNAYIQGKPISGLHPVSHEVGQQASVSKHACPKFGTHAEYAVAFTRIADDSRLHVIIGSLGGSELGFSAAKGYPFRVQANARVLDSQACKASYAASAVPISSSVVVGDSHCVTVNYVNLPPRRDRSGGITDVLEIDVIALDETKAPKDSSGTGKSCCCVQ